jgi:hypothetical protein
VELFLVPYLTYWIFVGCGVPEPELLLPLELLPDDELPLGVLGVDGPDGVDGVLVLDGVLGELGPDGQLAVASITDPSGHVLVVGFVVDGVNVCVHDGLVGFFVQSTGDAVPVVQLPAVHVDPTPDFPDANDFVVFTYGHVALSLHGGGGGGGVMPCSFASPMSQSLVLRFLSRSVMALLSARSHGLGLSWHLSLVRLKNWLSGQCCPPPDLSIIFVVSWTTTFICVGLLNI